jgi:hypothetical protein
MKSILPLCIVLLVLSGAIVFHAANGRYQFAFDQDFSGDHFSYAKFDTRTGEAWLCGAELDACIPMTNKAAFLASTLTAQTIGPPPSPAK